MPSALTTPHGISITLCGNIIGAQSFHMQGPARYSVPRPRSYPNMSIAPVPNHGSLDSFIGLDDTTSVIPDTGKCSGFVGQVQRLLMGGHAQAET